MHEYVIIFLELYTVITAQMGRQCRHAKFTLNLWLNPVFMSNSRVRQSYESNSLIDYILKI